MHQLNTCCELGITFVCDMFGHLVFFPAAAALLVVERASPCAGASLQFL
jgi:hypothetical protein